MPTPYHEAQTTNTSPPPAAAAAADNKWGPYSGPADFSVNMVITLVVLFSALLLGLAINFIVRFLLCARRRAPAADPEKAAASGKAGPSPADALPALVFSAGTKLAGTAADCAICLAEFVDGDRVRVMPACNHGFHVRCIEQWLASRISCPTCRASCLATVTVAAVAATPAAAASRVEMV